MIKTKIKNNQTINITKNSQEKFDLENENAFGESQILEDAISGLVNLGYARSEVFTVVMKIKRELTLQQKNKELTFDNIIPLALKYLSKEMK